MTNMTKSAREPRSRNLFQRQCKKANRCRVRAPARPPPLRPNRSPSYMLNTWNEGKNTVFYSYSACFVNTFALKMYVSMSYTGLTRRNMLFIFLWLRHRNTSRSIQHVGSPYSHPSRQTLQPSRFRSQNRSPTWPTRW